MEVKEADDSCFVIYGSRVYCTVRGGMQSMLAEEPIQQIPQLMPTLLKGDNDGLIVMACNPQFHKQAKHIEI